jgi:nucleoid-associated protein YgaU
MRLGAVFGESRIALLGAVLGGVAIVALAVGFALRQEPGPGAGPDVAEEPADAGTTSAAGQGGEPAVSGGAAAPDEPPGQVADSPPPPEPPRFDQIRVAPDGSAVIAGNAPPGADVSLRLDGAEIAATRSTAGGDFAAILTLAPADAPRILSLAARMPDGEEIAGAETVIIAPFGMDELQAARAEIDDESPEAASQAGADAAGGLPASAPAPGAAESAPAQVAASGAGQTAPDGSADAADPVGETAAAPQSPAESPPTDDIAAAETGPADTPAPEAPPAALPAPGLPEAARPAAEWPVAELPQAATPPDAGPVPERPASASPALVVAGPEGVRVLRGGSDGPPEAQTTIRIDAISYSAEGAVTVSGTGVADRQVQVLLDNRPIRTGEIGPGGQWSLELPQVDPGTYTLSVTQLAPGGEVDSRVDTPFLREDPARIAASPMLVGPGVSVITVQPGFTLWGIAEANFGEGIAYVQIFEENIDQIRDPDLIFPGQIFQLPDLPRDLPREGAAQ